MCNLVKHELRTLILCFESELHIATVVMHESIIKLHELKRYTVYAHMFIVYNELVHCWNGGVRWSPLLAMRRLFRKNNHLLYNQFTTVWMQEKPPIEKQHPKISKILLRQVVCLAVCVS